MIKIAGRRGLGLFAVPGIIEDEVKKLYGLSRVGVAVGIEEHFYAVSVERKVKHPGCNRDSSTAPGIGVAALA